MDGQFVPGVILQIALNPHVTVLVAFVKSPLRSTTLLESEIDTLATFVALNVVGKTKLAPVVCTSFVSSCEGQFVNEHVSNQLVHSPAKFVQTPTSNAFVFVLTHWHNEFVQDMKSKPFENTHVVPSRFVKPG
jgi:hypothetical protein